MATSVTWNNTSYSIPAAGEINWSSLSNFLIALGGGAGQPGAQVAGKAQKVGMRVVTAAGTVTVSDVDDCVVEINKTSGAATLVSLPAGVAGRIFMIVDGKGDAASNNITISPNPPETIMGASNYVMNVNKSAVIIGYDGSDWKIIATYEGASIPDSRLATISTAGKVANSATTAASANTASAIVARDASGNFSAGTITANLSGNATTATSTTNFSGSLSGDVTGTQSSTAISDSTVTGKALTGFVSGAGTVSATDTILQAFNKIDGNVAGKEPTITTLAASKGGLATDASAFTGVVKASSGTFSAATIVDADVSASAAISGTKISPNFGSQNVATTGSVSGTNVVNAGYEEFSQIATPSNPASNKVRVYAKSDSKMYLKDSSGNETAIGSGSGSSGVNYLSDWYDATKQVTSVMTGITNGTSNIVTTAGSFVVGATYTILTIGTTDFTAIGASSNTVGVTFIATGVGSGTGTARHAGWVTANVDVRWANSGSYVVGTYYYIRTVGTTDFTLIGAASNTVGLLFRATGVGAGTGTAFNAVVYSQTSSALRGTTNYAISVAGNDGTGNSDFIQTPAFQLDGVDLKKAISISFDCAGAAQANGTQGYDVIAVRYNSSGVFQELIPIAGTASTATVKSALLPLGTATFNGFFISGSTASDYYAIRWRSIGNNGNTLIFDSVTVGPQQVLQGAIVTDWTEEAITWNQDPGLNTSGSYVAPKIKWRRVGSNMEGFYDFRNGGSTASNSVQVSFRLPQGVTLDSTKYTALPGGAALVGFARKGSVAADALNYYPAGAGTPSKSIYIYPSNTVLPANDSHYGWFSVPILEWQSNTQQAARAVEEYAYNTSSSTTTSDTTSFAYGPQGALIRNITADLSRRVRFQTPILSTDSLVVEVSTDGLKWIPMNNTQVVNGIPVNPLMVQSGVRYGMGRIEVVNTTDVDITFGQYAQNSGAYGAAGTAWSGGAGSGYWRVRKVSGGAAVGFPIAPANITLIDNSDNYGGNTKLGLMQYVSGTNYNGGISPTLSGTGLATTRGVFVPYQMSDGTWRLKFNFRVTATSTTQLTVTINGVTFKNVSNYFQSVSNFPGGNYGRGNVNPNTGQITLYSDLTATAWAVSGDVELESKPTWAY